MTSRLLDVEGAAEYLSVTPRFIRRLVAERRVPFVKLGRHLRFDPADRESKLEGLFPVGWFPGALVFDAPRRTLAVANIKGLPEAKKRQADTGAMGFNSKHYAGSLSLVPVPTASDLPKLSETVWRNLRRDAVIAAREGLRIVTNQYREGLASMVNLLDTDKVFNQLENRSTG